MVNNAVNTLLTAQKLRVEEVEKNLAESRAKKHAMKKNYDEAIDEYHQLKSELEAEQAVLQYLEKIKRQEDTFLQERHRMTSIIEDLGVQERHRMTGKIEDLGVLSVKFDAVSFRVTKTQDDIADNSKIDVTRDKSVLRAYSEVLETPTDKVSECSCEKKI